LHTASQDHFDQTNATIISEDKLNNSNKGNKNKPNIITESKTKSNKEGKTFDLIDYLMKKVVLQERRYLLKDFFNIEEAHLQFELRSGEMSPTVRRLHFERGDSSAAVVWHAEHQELLFCKQFK